MKKLLIAALLAIAVTTTTQAAVLYATAKMLLKALNLASLVALMTLLHGCNITSSASDLRPERGIKVEINSAFPVYIVDPIAEFNRGPGGTGFWCKQLGGYKFYLSEQEYKKVLTEWLTKAGFAITEDAHKPRFILLSNSTNDNVTYRIRDSSDGKIIWQRGIPWPAEAKANECNEQARKHLQQLVISLAAWDGSTDPKLTKFASTAQPLKPYACLEGTLQRQVDALRSAGFNVKFRRSGNESEWLSDPAPTLPQKARHFMKKVENENAPIWYTAQIYINPSGFYLADKTETSAVGRKAFRIYMFTPAGNPGVWGNETKFANEPFSISEDDILEPPGNGDYIVAIMPITGKLPAQIGQILDSCKDLSSSAFSPLA